MKNRFALIGILLIGLLLRLLLLSSRPDGLTWDEAALGYNAYSLLRTGRDEYGQIMPLVFKSFGDYKPGLYVYTTVLPVFVFGLNIFASRFTSAVFGSLSILVMYLLTKKIYPSAALAGSLLMAVSPWAIHFSRGAWESNLALFFTLLAVTLFLYKKYGYSILFFGLTFFTYQGAKLFTPLLIIGLLFFYKFPIKKSIFFLFLSALFTVPLIVGFPEQSGRLKVFSVFSYTRTPQTISSILRQDNLISPDSFFRLYHSEAIDQGRGIVQRFLNHLSPRYLFVTGDWSNPRHSIPYQGYFFYPQIVLLVIGFAHLIKNYPSKTAFMVFWIISTVLPSAFSRDIVSGVRSLPLVAPLVIISSIGLSRLCLYRKYLIVWSALSILFFAYFLDLYFIHIPKLNGADWLSVYRPAVSLVSQYGDQYSDIYFSDKLGQPYIFILFFNKIDPSIYQRYAHLTENAYGDVGKVTSFGKYHFGPIYWPTMRSYQSSLFVGDIYELPVHDLNQPNIVDYGLISYPNGAPAFRIVGTL